MLTAEDFLDNNVEPEDNNTIDSIIEGYVYPDFQAGKTYSNIYENILIQEGIDKKQFIDRLKELKFKVSAGSIDGDKVIIIKLK